jgi:hypothetical protein
MRASTKGKIGRERGDAELTKANAPDVIDAPNFDAADLTNLNDLRKPNAAPEVSNIDGDGPQIRIGGNGEAPAAEIPPTANPVLAGFLARLKGAR